MQVDMHFYGTYALARAAGIPRRDAETLAYAAQFVDDSNHQDSQMHPDGGLLYGIATAHTDVQCVKNYAKNKLHDKEVEQDEQRRVWVPFHFLPGGAGEKLEERLLCVKDSAIAQKMITHHCNKVITEKPAFGLELLGIAAHVYLDTFAHYGFSGIGSEYNKVKSETIECIGVENEKMERYLLDKKGKFIDKWGLRKCVSWVAGESTGDLGHARVATYPDRPFLHWRVTFEKARPDNGNVSDRDNPCTYLEGCEKLHRHLSDFVRRRDNPDAAHQPFEQFKDKVEEILRFEGEQKDRIKKWRTAIAKSDLYPAEDDEVGILYSHEEWEREKDAFHKKKTSKEGTETHVYRFHQAAALHRYYVLKELLPAHGIAVY